MMSNGWEKFGKYVGVQGVLALIIVIALCTMLIMRREVPPEMYGLAGTTLGFYFAKNGGNIVTAVRSRTTNRSG